MIKVFLKENEERRKIVHLCGLLGDVYEYQDKIVIKVDNADNKKECLERISNVLQD